MLDPIGRRAELSKHKTTTIPHEVNDDHSEQLVNPAFSSLTLYPFRLGKFFSARKT